MSGKKPRRVVVGITGSTGSIYGIRMLEVLRGTDGIETHLVISAPGKRTITTETSYSVKQVQALAHVVYDDGDIGAQIASGSFRTCGMVIAPCSVKTAAALAHCYGSTLVARAGDVTLKEGRPLIVLVRETPLHVGHLRVMLSLAEMGAVVMPPLPAFYLKPRTIAEMIDHTVGRVLERLGLPQQLVPEWTDEVRTDAPGKRN
jgi:4-hydroxy-3-polyprenylbenzoate decarboxylase